MLRIIQEFADVIGRLATGEFKNAKRWDGVSSESKVLYLVSPEEMFHATEKLEGGTFTIMRCL